MVQSTIQLTVVIGGLRAQNGAGGCRVGIVVGACRQVMGANWCIGWCTLLGAPGVWLGTVAPYKLECFLHILSYNDGTLAEVQHT